MTEIDLIIQFLWQFFVFLFYFKRSQSQDLGIRQLVSALQRQLFIFLVHDCYPPHTAERQSNPEVLILCNSVVCIPPHFPAKEFKWNLNSRLVFLAICFLICKKGNFFKGFDSVYKNQLVLLNVTIGVYLVGKLQDSEPRRKFGT